MNRRSLMLNSLAASLLPNVFGAAATAFRDDASQRVPEVFLTLAEVRAGIQRLESHYPRLIRRRVLGVSRYGQPIDLISLGDGRKSALLIAGVHANEPVGSLTVDALMRRLASDDALRAALDTTWHFISPIDPDGMLLNQGWFKRPLTPRSYLRDFYRPAFARQPDYTFPLRTPNYTFTASPPENAAWRLALDLTRPDWQFSLHNAEFGGAFFLTSREDLPLQAALRAVPPACGLPLSSVGEPPGELASRAPGIFAMPRIGDLTGGHNKTTIWTAGDTSTDYADQFGTFSFTTETPYWGDPRAFDPSPSTSTLAEVVRNHLDQTRSGIAILEAGGALFDKTGSAVDELIYALEEQIMVQRSQLRTSPTVLGSQPPSRASLSQGDARLNIVQLQLFGLRGHAMLSRLARMNPTIPGAQAALASADCFIDAQLREITRSSTLRPFDLRALVDIQYKSALIVAAFIASG